MPSTIFGQDPVSLILQLDPRAQKLRQQQQLVKLLSSISSVRDVPSEALTGDTKSRRHKVGGKKARGFLGPLRLKDGSVATEFSIGVPILGRQTEIPTLVPTLDEREIRLMIDDIIPNRKPIPDSIVRKAAQHAIARIREGKSPFFEPGERMTKLRGK